MSTNKVISLSNQKGASGNRAQMRISVTPSGQKGTHDRRPTQVPLTINLGYQGSGELTVTLATVINVIMGEMHPNQPKHFAHNGGYPHNFYAEIISLLKGAT